MTRSTPDRPTADHDAPVSYDWIHLEHDLVGWLMSAVGHDEPSRLVVELPGGHATVLASGDLFVTDPVVRSALAQRAHLVDMEGYAIALACTELGVPVHLVRS